MFTVHDSECPVVTTMTIISPMHEMTVPACVAAGIETLTS